MSVINHHVCYCVRFSIAAIIYVPVFSLAYIVDRDAVWFSVSVPQSLSIASSTGEVLADYDEKKLSWTHRSGEVVSALHVSWDIASNNAFRYQFAGQSLSDQGAVINYPRFTKQDIDADGQLVEGAYDHLDTYFGVSVSDFASVEKASEWGGASSPVGSPQQLVKQSYQEGSPYSVMGKVMPEDNTGKAKIHLYAIGLADNLDQAGIYNTSVTLTVTAEEQII